MLDNSVHKWLLVLRGHVVVSYWLATLLVHTSGPLKCSSGLRLRLLDCCVSPWYTCVRELWSVGRSVGGLVGRKAKSGAPCM